MTFTYDLATVVGQARLYSQDTVEANSIFSDEELQVFLDNNENNVYGAASDALEIIAANQAYVLKVIKNNGLETDGAATAEALRASAANFRAKASSNSGTIETGVVIVPNADDYWLPHR